MSKNTKKISSLVGTILLAFSVVWQWPAIVSTINLVYAGEFKQQQTRQDTVNYISLEIVKTQNLILTELLGPPPATARDSLRQEIYLNTLRSQLDILKGLAAPDTDTVRLIPIVPSLDRK